MGSMATLVVGCKLINSIMKNLLPLHLLELGLKGTEQVFSTSLEQSLLVLAMIQPLISLAPSLSRPRHTAYASQIHASASLLLYLSVAFPGAMTSVLPEPEEYQGALYLLMTISSCVANMGFARWALESKTPLSRVRMWGTLVSSAVLCALLAHPEVLKSSVVVTGIVVITTISIAGLARIEAMAAPQAGQEAEKGKRAKKGSGDTAEAGVEGEGVGPVVGVLACLLLSVGLNGEQILDASSTLEGKHELLQGKRTKLLTKYAITACLSMVTVFWLRRSKGGSNPKAKKTHPYITCILLWAGAQVARLAWREWRHVVGEEGISEWNQMGGTALMMLIDKYTAPLGEMALEHTLITLLLANSCKGKWMNTVWLMSCYDILEDLTGSSVKLMVLSSHGGGTGYRLMDFFLSEKNEEGWMGGWVSPQTCLVLFLVTTITTAIIFIQVHFKERTQKEKES